MKTLLVTEVFFLYHDRIVLMILGIDEVGRGPWAGPLVVGAVVLGGADIPGLTDSKKLTKRRREELDVLIRELASGFGLGWVDASEIDEIGLSAALRLATIRAVSQIKVPYHEIIIDGTINFLADTNKGKYVTTMPKADLLVPSVSAASIIAKVARDNYMVDQDRKYDGYDFSGHVGYGTAKHIAAIEKNGVTPLHRLSFSPLRKYKTETTKDIGNQAEDVAARFLVKSKHKIIARNFKTKTYEIDIVSKKDDTYYFNEVKYRKNNSSGDGLDAITSKKLKQMVFAARSYVQKFELDDKEIRLMAISMSGSPVEVDDYLEV